jgi:hypothetical protein
MKSTKHNPGQPGQPAPAKAPLAAHPLFPALVALWTAALLAVAGLMLPVGPLERAVALVHLDSLVPAARPPLGFTARLLVAFVLAVGGAGVAYVAAGVLRRRGLAALGRPLRTAPRATSRAAPAKTVIASEPNPVADDEDLTRLAAAKADAAPRRRGLTSEAADVPSILEISALPALEPLAPEPEVAAGDAPPPPVPAVPETAPRLAGEPRFRTASELAGAAALRLCAVPLESLGVVQLVERFALALAARPLRHAGEPTLVHEPAPHPAVATPPPFAEPRDARPIPAAGRPFDEPATPVEAFGDIESAPVTMPDDGFAPLTVAPLLARRPTRESGLTAMSEPLDEVVEDEVLEYEDEDEGDLSRWALPEPEDEGEDIAEDLTPDPGSGDGYSSLLAMRPSTRVPPPLADFVRVEDLDDLPSPDAGPQPVVVFPGQARPAPPVATVLPGMDTPPTPEETEQALRQALAALQRMSGAA